MNELVLSRYFNNNRRFADGFSRTSYEKSLRKDHILNKGSTCHDRVKKNINFCDMMPQHFTTPVLTNDKEMLKKLTKSKENTGFPGFAKEEKEYSSNRFKMVDIMYGSPINEFHKKNYYTNELRNDDVALFDCDNNLHQNIESKYFKNLSKTSQSFEKLTLPTRVKQQITKESTKHYFKSFKKPATPMHNTVLEKPLGKEFEDDIKKITDIDYEKEYFRALSNKCQINSNTNDEINMELKSIHWIPPRSPHNLIEEVLYHDPWALLVATIFLNKTACKLARPHIFWFLVENPGPMSVMDRFPKDLEKYFENLGLNKSRAVQIWRMTNEYLQKNWKKPSDLYGIGNYGECAYRMFYLGDFSVEPNDRFLRIYKGWYKKIMGNNLNV